MAKRGRKNHVKRIAVPKAIPIQNKKESTWMVNSNAGPHSKDKSIPLGVFLRDVVSIVRTLKEAKRILHERKVLVDGFVRTDVKFPIGLMDVVSIPEAEKHYRIIVDWKGRLVPMEIDAKESQQKILKVENKSTLKKGKISLALHDGRNLLADNNIKVGDSIVLSLPKSSLKKHLKLEKGSRCFVREGNHAGSIAVLEEIVNRQSGKPAEARLKSKNGEFITVAKYLLVVDEKFEVSK